MKQLLQHLRSGKLKLEDVPAPVARAGVVVVRNEFSVVSAGTERASVEFARGSILSKARSRPDLVRTVLNKVRTDGIRETYRNVVSRLDQYVPLGYSSAGTVLEVGDGVTHVGVGDLVACAGAGYASHSAVIAVPRNLTVKVPDGVGARDGAFATLGAIALQGIRRAELTPGESVAVIGLGLLGQITVQLLHAYGFPVMGLDIDAERVEAMKEKGIEAAAVIGRDDPETIANAMSAGVGLDAVIITAAATSNEPIELAGQILRERGRVSAVGDVGLDVPRRVFYSKELDLRISRSYGPGRYDTSYEEHGVDYPVPYARWTEQRNMAEFLRLVASKRVDIDSIVTHTFEFGDAESAYDLVVSSPSAERYLGVVLEYPADARALERVVEISSPRRRRQTGTLNIGLIGAGNFVRSSILPSLSALKNVRIRGVASAGGNTATDIATRVGADYATTEFRRIIDDPEIDLVVAAARHNLNPEIAAEALTAGKHVHVEKPLAITREQLAAIVDASEKSDGILAVGFNRRFAPHAIAIREHFAGGGTPLVMHYRVNAGFIPADHWTHDPVEGGGRILGEVCHFIDLLQFFAGARPTRVFATRLPESSGTVLPDDNVVITVDFADGSRGSINYSALGAANQPKEQIELMGSGRSATLTDFRRVDLYSGAKSRVLKGRPDKGHQRQFAALVNAIETGDGPPVAFDQLVSSTSATLCVLESLNTGEPVTVPATAWQRTSVDAQPENPG